MWGATGGQKRKVIRGGGEGYFGEQQVFNWECGSEGKE